MTFWVYFVDLALDNCGRSQGNKSPEKGVKSLTRPVDGEQVEACRENTYIGMK